MKLPTIRGLIDRRILVNYHVDPIFLRPLLPEPFRPKLAHGQAIAGICLIRLKHVRPAGFPAAVGLCSENAAHRIAVEWDQDGITRDGVYVARRDSSSRLNAWAGGRLFPGFHHHARFQTAEQNGHYRIDIASDDGATRIILDAKIAAKLPATSVFGTLAEVSAFFETGSLGYSPRRDSQELDALELRCQTWSMELLEVHSVQSSFFDDASQFPPGAAGLDCALLMRGIEHEWHTREPMSCACAPV